MNEDVKEVNSLKKYLSPLSVWALSFGCAVGWGAFVMPGTTFLPKAGPLGTVLGIVIGAVIMMVIGINYAYLMGKYPDSGGTLTYTAKSFGYDHGFMSSWFLMLVYIAIIWANATALGLISKNLLGTTFRFGFYYEVLGYEVYFGEVLLSIIAILICGFTCIYFKRLSAILQVLFAFILIFAVIVCAALVFKSTDIISTRAIFPLFSDNERHPVSQISTIVALSPWAYVGFESVSNSVSGFNFKHTRRKMTAIMVGAVFAGMLCYVLLTLMATAYTPEGVSGWQDFVKKLDSFTGIEGLPTFYAAYKAMGKAGVFLLGLAAFAGIVTGLIGNLVAASRLLFTMAEDGILPKWFGKLNKKSSPQNALLFLMIVSVIVPFLGRTAIGWIVDVSTVGAAIAYAYTSAAAWAEAIKDKKPLVVRTGQAGVIFSFIFFIYFMSWSAGALSTESYLILAFWSILGFVYFRIVFAGDKDRRFGKSTIVWIVLLFLIFFTSLMWVKQSTDEITEEMAKNISQYYEQMNPDDDPEKIEKTENYLNEQLKHADDLITRNSFIQMLLIIAALAIMFSIYSLMTSREKKAEAEKVKAIERSKAKTIFLSNMSHDIRTPMNAIIGYINLAEREDITLPELKEYLGKIKGSSHHLLALINDVLEMSRIESGKMDLEPIPMDIVRTMEEVKDLFQTQMDEKHIQYVVDASNIKDGYVYCDKNRLNRVLLNLIGNAYKFTPEGGCVAVKAWEIQCEDPEYTKFEIRVKDSGIGMSKEFADKVFEAFERERTSTVSGIEGTGLGMSIAKSIVDMMGGDITINTAPGMGTEFVITLRLKRLEEDKKNALIKSTEAANTESGKDKIDYSNVRVLLTDDMKINREIASKLLERIGFRVEQAENGKEALDKVASSEPGYYDLVLMDIQMPVMGGYEAAENIRRLENKELSDIPIIAMTANAFSEDVKKAMDAGMNGHIAKPIDVNNMLSTINEVLTRSGTNN